MLEDYVTVSFFTARIPVSRPTIYAMLQRSELPSPDLVLQSGRRYWRRATALEGIDRILNGEVRA